MVHWWVWTHRAPSSFGGDTILRLSSRRYLFCPYVVLDFQRWFLEPSQQLKYEEAFQTVIQPNVMMPLLSLIPSIDAVLLLATL